jgi:chromosome segregation ATPase
MRLLRFIIFINVTVFAVSFGLSAAIARNFTIALLVATVGTVASSLGSTAIYKRRLLEQRAHRNSLYAQIEDLEQEEEQIYHSLYEANVTKQEIEGSVQALQSEYERLRLRVSELYNQRSVLHQNLTVLKKQHQQQVEPLQKLQQQIQFLETRQTQVKHSLEVKTTEVQQTETRLNALKHEIQRAQNELETQNKQREEQRDRIFLLDLKKQELEQQIQQIQGQLEETTFEASPVQSWSSNQVTERFNLISLLPQEWLDIINFMEQLNDLEKEIFQAILEKSEKQLKEIADRHTTMPEVLIESLNERALNIWGDILFVKSSNSTIPEFNEECKQILEEPIQLELKKVFKLFLNCKLET